MSAQLKQPVKQETYVSRKSADNVNIDCMQRMGGAGDSTWCHRLDATERHFLPSVPQQQQHA